MKKKSIFIALILSFLFIINTTKGQKNIPLSFHEVERIDSIPNFFKSNDFYFSGQLNEATLTSLKEDGVDLVINLRSEAENAKNQFNEEELVNSLGMKYISVPMSGASANNPKTLKKVAKAIKKSKGKILIHCASCGRVTNVWMAYLIKHQRFSIDEAIAVGKQLKFKFYLEDLLGKEITMDIKNKENS